MKLFERFTHKAEDPDTAVYTVEGKCTAAIARPLCAAP
jgi:hypothetical protein